MEFISRTDRDPFDLDPPCDRYVPGYGATNADFHVIGDHPGVHGGLTTGIPFTDRPWSERFFRALERGGLVDAVDLTAGTVTAPRAFLSYLHTCEVEGEGPGADDYALLEPFFDAELRAITAHVLLPVGAVATAHVLTEYTARPVESGPSIEMDALHGRELRGSGWLVVPIKDPGAWGADDADRLIEGLQTLRARDYRRESDLGRFLPDDQSYHVR